MSLPTGVLTATVVIGPEIDDAGRPYGDATQSVFSFISSTPKVWAATSATITPRPVDVVLDETGSGSVVLAATDQPGFTDGAGNEVRDWTYTVTRRYRGGATTTTTFQLPTDGVTGVSVPLGSLAAVEVSDGVLVAVPVVLSVDGQTGAVVLPRSVPGGLAELDGDGDVVNAAGEKVTGGGLDEEALDDYLTANPPAPAPLSVTDATVATAAAIALSKTSDSTASTGRLAMTNDERTKLSGVATGATANSSDATLLARASHTGTQSADTLTDGTTNKAFLATERTKLSGIATAATANSADATLLARANHTGTQSADTISDGTTNKAFLATERTKLSGIATSATANDTDANLKARANHTGTQAQSTVTNLTTDLAALAPKASPTFTGTVSGVTKTHVSLGNVDNVQQVPASSARIRIAATALNTWPARTASLPSGFAGPAEWDHSAYGAVSTLPVDIATNDIVTDLAP